MTKPPMGLEELARHMSKLVAMSPVRLRLLQCLTEESPDSATLTELVESDSVIAARTLRVANSPFFGLAHEVVSISHAVSLVGQRSLQAMALAAAVMEQFKSSDPALHASHQAHWRHSVAVAVCSQALARKARLPPEAAFSAGLLSHLGQLVMLTIDPVRYDQVQELAFQPSATADVVNPSVPVAQRLLEAERTVWGFDHCEVGEQLARLWSLPAMLRRCMSLHHQCNDPQADAMVWLVHVSHALAHALDLLQEPHDQVPDIQVAAWDGLGLDWSDSSTLFSEIEARYQLACQQLMN